MATINFPSAPALNDQYIFNNKTWYWDGVAWTLLANPTTPVTANLLGGAAGSVPYQSAINTTAMLPIGTAGQVLTVVGSAPQWSAATGGGGETISSFLLMGA